MRHLTFLFHEYESWSVAASTGLRMVTGFFLAWFHGWHKVEEGYFHFFFGEPWPFTAEIVAIGFPFPELSGAAAGLTQFLGGLAIAFGLLVRPAAAAVAGTLIVAVYANTILEKEQQFALLYLALTLWCLTRGAGPYSIDAYLAKRWSA